MVEGGRLNEGQLTFYLISLHRKRVLCKIISIIGQLILILVFHRAVYLIY